MIVDHIKNQHLYSGLDLNIETALKLLHKIELLDLTDGRHDVNGDSLYYLVNEYFLTDESQLKLEAHKKYIDIHYIMSGVESIGHSIMRGHKIARKYDKQGDYALYTGEYSMFNMNSGMFSVFFPGELHMPGVGSNNTKVKKIVFKVMV
jgi:YhcH/YjgK/YiaL family protein